MTQFRKTSLIAHLKVLRNDSFKHSECSNGGSYVYQIFSHFTTIYYFPDHPLKKWPTAKFPALLDSLVFKPRLAVSGEFLKGWKDEGLEGGKDAI